MVHPLLLKPCSAHWAFPAGIILTSSAPPTSRPVSGTAFVLKAQRIFCQAGGGAFGTLIVEAPKGYLPPEALGLRDLQVARASNQLSGLDRSKLPRKS